jgi:hypothetical protein
MGSVRCVGSAALLGVVDSAEGRPPPRCLEVFKDLSARLDADLATLSALEKTDLESFNRLARAVRLEPVTAK